MLTILIARTRQRHRKPPQFTRSRRLVFGHGSRHQSHVMALSRPHVLRGDPSLTSR